MFAGQDIAHWEWREARGGDRRIELTGLDLVQYLLPQHWGESEGMSYKGNDLDLRASYARSVREGAGNENGGPETGWKSPAAALGHHVPIPVDPTVLACCNCAYDVALFHGAHDVRVDHLLHALTRVDAAREILEQHGLRTAQLRRDTAVEIASDAAAGSAGGKTTPRASAELENLLRRAAGRAGEDHVPASVHDLMRAVLSYGREAPSTALLLGAAIDPEQLERWGAEQPAPLYSSAPYAAAMLRPEAAEALFGRIDTMEAAMRTLAAEVAADRKTMIDLLGEVQHDLRAARAESPVGVQATMDAKLDDLSQSVAGLAERFEAIRVFAPGDGGTDVTGRLAALESKLTAQPAAIADAVAYMMTQRRADPEGALQMTGEGGEPGWGTAAERLSGLEATLHAQTERMEEASKTHERDLSEIYEALVKLGTNQQTLGNNLEAWRLDSSGDVSVVSNRLENMERVLQATFVRPAPMRVVAESAPAVQPQQDASESSPARGNGFKRWLYGTGRVLPSSWREDANAIRESLRSVRRSSKT